MFIVEIFELVIIEKGITLSPTFEKRFTRFFSSLCLHIHSSVLL